MHFATLENSKFGTLLPMAMLPHFIQRQFALLRCFKFKLIAADNQLLLMLFNLLQARFHLQR
jgi:hypothetical protein